MRPDCNCLSGRQCHTRRLHLVYPRKLEDELWFLFPKATVNVINSGIGGDNSYGMLERFDRDVARYKPDLVTIMLGQNDCCNVDDDIDSKLSAFEKNTEELFRRTLDIGAECIYVTPWMCCKYVDPNMLSGELADVAFTLSQRQNTDLPDRFVDVAKNVAARMNIPIADAYAEWKLYDRCEIDITQLLANRINHPITKMHDIFVRKIIEQILADGPSD